MIRTSVAGALALVLFTTPAFAQTSGDLSESTSTGTFEINVSIPEMVRVSGLENLNIAVTADAINNPYASRQDATTEFCVYSNDGADGAYGLAVSATPGTSLPFALAGSGGETLEYSMWTSDDTGDQFKNYRFNGQVTSYLANGDGDGRPATIGCTDRTENASIKIGVDDSRILAAVAGDYTGTVTVTVSVI